ncbi:MAG: hypothetical protein JWN04_2509, partial [Myxococcaceae bacterium]|nr:hypothetical protein [Myxococcaceae bacterium]
MSGQPSAIMCKLRAVVEPLELCGFDGKLFKLR